MLSCAFGDMGSHQWSLVFLTRLSGWWSGFAGPNAPCSTPAAGFLLCLAGTFHCREAWAPSAAPGLGLGATKWGSGCPCPGPTMGPGSLWPGLSQSSELRGWILQSEQELRRQNCLLFIPLTVLQSLSLISFYTFFFLSSPNFLFS